MGKWLFFTWFLVFAIHTNAQEILCTAQILDNQIQLTDKRIFRTLEQVIGEFVTNAKWTNEKVQPNERIDMNIQIVLSQYDVASNFFKGTMQIVSRRPVYGSGYNTPVFNFLDENIEFNFQEFQPMNFNENSFTTNLTSLLAFYAYYVIGLDFDTFGSLGGTPYFNKALQVANNAQPTGIGGWQPFERNLRSRFNLVDNILNDRFKPFRDAYYKYHRQGLDLMYKEPEAARRQIFASLELMQKLFKIAPNTVILIVFFEAKSDELISIYKNAPATEKPKVISLLSEMNVVNASKYEKIRQ